MTFKFTIHDISNLNLDEIFSYSFVYCNLFQSQPISSKLGKSELFPINNSKIIINQQFTSLNILSQCISIEIHQSSTQFGSCSTGFININLQTSCIHPNDITTVPIQNPGHGFHGATLSFSYEIIDNFNSFQPIPASFPLEIVSDDYIILKIHSMHPHSIYLLHSSNTSYAELSDFHNIFIRHCLFFQPSQSTTIILFKSSLMSHNWPFVYFISQLSDLSDSLEVIISTSDENENHSKSSNNILNQLAAFSVEFSNFQSNINSNSKKSTKNHFFSFLSFQFLQNDKIIVSKNIQGFKYPLLREYLPEIVQDLKIPANFVPRLLSINYSEEIPNFPIFFRKKTPINPKNRLYGVFTNNDQIRVTLEYQRAKPIDLSLTTSNNSNLSETAFYNQKRIEKGSVVLEINSFTQILTIDFNRLPPKINNLLLGITSPSINDQTTEISNCLPMTLSFSTGDGITFAKLKIKPKEKKTSLLIGVFQKDENDWSFNYHNQSVDAKTPFYLAQQTIPLIFQLKEEIVWNVDSNS